MTAVSVGWVGVILPSIGALVAFGSAERWLRPLGATVGTLLLALAAFVLVHGPGLGLDPLSAWFFVPTCAVGGLGLWQSLSYLTHAQGADTSGQVADRTSQERTRMGSRLGLGSERRYVVLYLLFIASIVLVTVAPDLLVMWAAVEATTLASVLLVAHEGTGQAVEAAWKYIAITAVGGLIALFGTLAVLAGTHAALSMAPGSLVPHYPLSSRSQHLTLVGIAFVVIGYGTKVGLAPMYTWLPDAHSQAPAPVSGLLSGMELSVALYAMIRVLHLAAEGVGSFWPSHFLLALGLLSVLTASAFLVAQRDVKRLFAYSTVEHMGLIALGLGIGGLALWGALLGVWTHAAAKSLAFFGSGNIREHYGTSRLPAIRRLRHVLPWSTAFLGVAVWGLVGLPPFGSFVSEWLILTGAIGRGSVDTAVALVVAGLLALVLIGFGARLAGRLLDSEPKPAVSLSGAEGTEWAPVERAGEVWTLGLLAACTVVSGFAGLALLRLWLPHVGTLLGGRVIP